jgi:hypothetical protein
MTPEEQAPAKRTEHFLQCLPAGMPAEERLDQLTAHACEMERTLDRVLLQLADEQAQAVALRDLCDHAAEVIARGEDLSAIGEALRAAGEELDGGLELPEDELLEDAQQFLRCWRSHKQYGTGNADELRLWRKRLEADCNASGFMDAQILERAEKILDQDDADRIQGQQH